MSFYLYIEILTVIQRSNYNKPFKKYPGIMFGTARFVRRRRQHGQLEPGAEVCRAITTQTYIVCLKDNQDLVSQPVAAQA